MRAFDMARDVVVLLVYSASLDTGKTPHPMSSEQPPIRHEKSEIPSTVAELEGKMTEARQRLKEAEQRVRDARQLWDEQTQESEVGRQAWEAWKQARNAYASLVEEIANQEVAWGEHIDAPDGNFMLDIQFPHGRTGEPVMLKEPIYRDPTQHHLGALIKKCVGFDCQQRDS